jgi:hypothetical protein
VDLEEIKYETLDKVHFRRRKGLNDILITF